MLSERRTAFIQTLVNGGPPNPFLRVRVRRDALIEDAMLAVSDNNKYVNVIDKQVVTSDRGLF